MFRQVSRVLLLLALLPLSAGFSPVVHSMSAIRRSNIISENAHCSKPMLASSLTTLSTTSSAASSVAETANAAPPKKLTNLQKKLTKIGMIAFIATVALGLITSLNIIRFMGFLKIGTKTQRQKWALRTGQFCARWALRLFPFCNLKVIADESDEYRNNPDPSIWVCNHTSMLDVFLLLAGDLKMRGKKKRPIKIVYWKALESNPFTKILFQESGFIPVEMEANKPGEPNSYNPSSLKQFLKEAKQAFEEGFDIGILPEGQLNPTPEKGLLPSFSGAFFLAKMSRRPIHMLAMHGVNQLWHPNDGMEVGDMNVTGRDVKIRAYPQGRKYQSNDEFVATFETVVGHFGKHGTDVEGLDGWLDGTTWKDMKAEEERIREAAIQKELLEQQQREEEAAKLELEEAQAKE